MSKENEDWTDERIQRLLENMYIKENYLEWYEFLKENDKL
jgi:hypothetical protein